MSVNRLWPLLQSDVKCCSTFARARADRSVKGEMWLLLQYLSC